MTPCFFCGSYPCSCSPFFEPRLNTFATVGSTQRLYQQTLYPVPFFLFIFYAYINALDAL
ncbi:hypothetical protein BDV06DRAFT_190673, partial [Aspergillus oleicola]